MITVSSNTDEVIKSLNSVTKNLSKEIGVAAWKTARFGEGNIAKKITKELATPQREIKKKITSKRSKGGATVELDKSKRLALKQFNPRQNKAGVTYKISKSKGRKLLKSGFMGPKPGAIARRLHGHVWFRVGPKVAQEKGRYKGRMRQKILKAYGPSPWGVFVKGGNKTPTRNEISQRFGKELAERLRYLHLKQLNQLSWQQPTT